ncbi:MAG TPA: hypothetical protein VHV78_02450 [Gemmatimonadaceae bacterium]|nr:hypothetical protein [Gemmatimonadaceae bacterium]
MTESLTRRHFIAVVGLGLCSTPAGRVRRSRPPRVQLRVGRLDSSSMMNADRRDGATLGVEEARHAAEMFGGSVDLMAFADPRQAPHDATALLGDDDAGRCKLLAAAASSHGQLFFNVVCASDALGDARCSPTAFHVWPSDAMCRDARASVKASAAADVVAWDGSLVRFGADSLNLRYSRRFGRPMTPAAWCSWLAIKILWETSLRAKRSDPAVLSRTLISDSTQFDGHKGRPLSFRSWDRQLRQPLYVRSASTLVEAPRPTGEDESSRDVLDLLGGARATSACHST